MSRLKEKLGLKLTYAFIGVIIVVLVAFTSLAVVHEGTKEKADLIEHGTLLARVLSHTLVVGVFAENEKLLNAATEGIMNTKEVVSVTIYNADLVMLFSRGKTLSGDKKGVPPLGRVQSLTIVETPDHFEFMEPILINLDVKSDELLYFGHAAEGSASKVIGYVRIISSKDSYHKEMNSIVARNAVVMLIFIFVGVIIIYVAVKKVTRPLDTLTRSVKELEKGRRVEQVPVETGDEIGNLAAAFNAMIVSRGMAEESLRSVVSEMSLMESRIEERERHLIAADLHDFVGQNLALLMFNIAVLRKMISSPEQIGQLEEIRELIGRTIQYTRSLTVELNPPVLTELGFEAAVESLAESIQKTYGIHIAIANDGLPKHADDEIRYILYRIVRELLMNAVKHARASQVKICLARDENTMHISVEDNGVGFDAKKDAGKGSGFGLFTIRERLKRLGGYFAIDTRSGSGTKVTLSVPLKFNEKGIS